MPLTRVVLPPVYIYIGMVYWYGYGLYILVRPALLPSSLSWRFLNFVFFFRWALKASPKASYQEKQTESKLSTNMQKYLWWLFNIYCLILLFVMVMLIIMMPYKKLILLLIVMGILNKADIVKMIKSCWWLRWLLWGVAKTMRQSVGTVQVFTRERRKQRVTDDNIFIHYIMMKCILGWWYLYIMYYDEVSVCAFVCYRKLSLAQVVSRRGLRCVLRYFKNFFDK